MEQVKVKSERGRKPVSDKKRQVNFMVRESDLQKLGGRKGFQELVYRLVKKVFPLKD